MRKDSNKPVKFYIFNGLVSLPLIFVMLAPSWTLLFFLIFISVLLTLLESKGMDLNMLIRKIRRFFAGTKVSNISTTRKIM